MQASKPPSNYHSKTSQRSGSQGIPPKIFSKSNTKDGVSKLDQSEMAADRDEVKYESNQEYRLSSDNMIFRKEFASNTEGDEAEYNG